MRSPSKRSRSKSNRPKTLGNIVNRVFDSSGPEGKVRGTPQQIIEKYQILARDAQLANDRVAAENFQQHAEHYTRMLAQAQREQAAEQEARRQSQEEQRTRHDDRGRNNGNGQNIGNGNGNQGHANAQPRNAEQSDTPRADAEQRGTAFDVADPAQDEDSALVVDTPESQSTATPDQGVSKPRNSRKPRAPKPDAGGEAAKPRPAPRKPRASDADELPAELKSSAAE